MSGHPIAVLVDREGLGDSLLKLPFLRAIARAYPNRPIWWISSNQTAMAHELAPYVRNVLAKVVENAGLTIPAGEVIKRLRELPEFELVFDSRTRGLTVLLAKLFLTHRGFFCSLPGYMLSDRGPPRRFARPRHVGLRALSMAQAALGGMADWGGRLDCSDAARARAQALLPDDATYVGLAVGSREARKNWPLERFAALARLLADRGLVPVLLTGPQEQKYKEEIRRLLPDAVDPGALTGPLDGVIAVARRLAMMVATDSGLGHLCGACGCPVVSLFGPMDPARWAPFAPSFRVLRAPDYGGEATGLIPEGDVLAAIESLVAENAGDPLAAERNYAPQYREIRRAARAALQ